MPRIRRSGLFRTGRAVNAKASSGSTCKSCRHSKRMPGSLQGRLRRPSRAPVPGALLSGRFPSSGRPGRLEAQPCGRKLEGVLWRASATASRPQEWLHKLNLTRKKRRPGPANKSDFRRCFPVPRTGPSLQALSPPKRRPEGTRVRCAARWVAPRPGKGQAP